MPKTIEELESESSRLFAQAAKLALMSQDKDGQPQSKSEAYARKSARIDAKATRIRMIIDELKKERQ